MLYWHSCGHARSCQIPPRMWFLLGKHNYIYITRVCVELAEGTLLICMWCSFGFASMVRYILFINESIFSIHPQYFILVGSILLRNVYIKYKTIRRTPAIATESILLMLFSYFTTCFGPTGPSSGETQYTSYNILRKPSLFQWIRCS
jgi:hypothetical protein